MTLWANLHGGFVFGLALLAPFAFDALWNQEASRRTSLALRWIAFGLCALAASCVTPYGWESILAARKILDLGELLHLIYEWMPADFSRFGLFEACVFALIAGALYCGVKLSPPRIVLVLILFSYGPFTCSKYRDLRFADAACGDLAPCRRNSACTGLGLSR
jgi:hypothetical protein